MIKIKKKEIKNNKSNKHFNNGNSQAKSISLNPISFNFFPFSVKGDPKKTKNFCPAIEAGGTAKPEEEGEEPLEGKQGEEGEEEGGGN